MVQRDLAKKIKKGNQNTHERNQTIASLYR